MARKFGLVPSSTADVTAMQTLVNKNVDWAMEYNQYPADPNWTTPDFNTYNGMGKTLVVSVGMGSMAGLDEAWVTSYANVLKTWAGQIIVRPNWEMNGTWANYLGTLSERIPGTLPRSASYIHLWRRVHDLFVAAGVTNATWAWSPNIDVGNGSVPVMGMYPGDAYVDYVGLDGYNWGTNNTSGWQTWTQLFAGSIATLQQLTSKPIFIFEIGCSPNGGDKAAWITDFFNQLVARPYIAGFIWFNLDQSGSGGPNWRIDSSSAASTAFRNGIALI